jgi:chromate transporter
MMPPSATPAGLAGGLLAALVAFSPFFAFIVLGARRLDRIQTIAGATALPDLVAPRRRRFG